MIQGNKDVGGDPPDVLLESAGASESFVQVISPSEDENNVSYSEGLTFRSSGDGSCTVTGMGSCSDRTVAIPPQSPTGDTVTAIGHSAFKGIVAIGEVILPDTVMTIGEDAFKGSGIVSVSIGGSVISIGEEAFALCRSLTAINVSQTNAMYSSKDGVLFTRDMTDLICYPSGKANRSYTIPLSVERISPCAFSECANLKEISFGGTQKQWNSVYVCSGNDSLYSSNLSFAPDEK